MNLRKNPPDTPITIYCDGSCLDNSNQGPGGWAALLEYNGRTKIVQGNEPNTTNNRMELTSAIQGLSALKRPCIVHIYSDSEYLVKGINENRKRNTNFRYWNELDELKTIHTIKFIWIKAHNGNAKNEIVNGLAQAQAKKLKDELK